MKILLNMRQTSTWHFFSCQNLLALFRAPPEINWYLWPPVSGQGLSLQFYMCGEDSVERINKWEKNVSVLIYFHLTTFLEIVFTYISLCFSVYDNLLRDCTFWFMCSCGASLTHIQHTLHLWGKNHDRKRDRFLMRIFFCLQILLEKHGLYKCLFGNWIHSGRLNKPAWSPDTPILCVSNNV